MMADKCYRVMLAVSILYAIGQRIKVFVPNDITPMAWKMPLLIVNSGVLKEPRSADGTSTPCTSTVTTMTSMPIRAIVLALANYLLEHY